MSDLEKLFYPKAIAVIGASRSLGKLGHDVLINAIQFGYRGKVFPVNPQTSAIAGLPCYSSVTAIAEKIEVAIIMVPSFKVNEVLTECGKKNIPFAVIISAGFKEIGISGAQLAATIKQTATKYHIRLVGPNCLGFINADIRLNASFASGMPDRGHISFVSQSGAMGVALLDWAYQSNLGFSKILSVGNKCDIDEVDCLRYLSRDKNTKVIMMYLESLERGREFMQEALKITAKKPLIVLKAGSSQHAQQAISSHTGSLAGSDQAISTAFALAHIIRAHSVEEFFDYGLAFSQPVKPQGKRIVIITNAGGPGIMATDALAHTDLALPTLSSSLQKKLQKKLPVAASTKNPIDVIGDASPARYEHALQTVLSSKEVDGAIVILTPQIMTDEDETALIVSRAAKQFKKPILASFMGGLDVNSGRMILKVYGVPNYDTPERAVKAMDQLVKQNINQVHYPLFVSGATKSKSRRLPKTTHVQIRTQEAENILAKYKLPVLKSLLITNERACEQIKKFPVVMKIASRDVIHKAASSAIRLNITNIKEAKTARREILRIVKKRYPQAEMEGVLVQPQLDRTSLYQEVIIGMKRDSSFGGMMMFGLGGSLVEIFHDVTFGIAPLRKEQAEKMVNSIKAKSLLRELDTRLIIKILLLSSRIALDYPQLQEFDMNPLMVYRRGGYIVDVRMMVK